MLTLQTSLRWAALAVACGVAGLAHGQGAAAPAPAALEAGLSEEQQLLWNEAIATFDGRAYRYTVTRFNSEAQARRCAERWLRCQSDDGLAHARFEQMSHELPLGWRQIITDLSADFASPPLVSASQPGEWLVLGLHERRAVESLGPMAPVEWLARFAATSLPSVAALRSDPDTSARHLLSTMQTPEALRRGMDSGVIQARHLDMVYPSGSTPLMRAVYNDNLPLMHALMQAGASPNFCGRKQCPLAMAVVLEHPNAVRLLLNRKADPSGGPRGFTPLMAAAVNADQELTQALLDAGADLLKTQTEALPLFTVKRSALSYASYEKPSYREWLLKKVDALLAAQGQYAWSAWIEQDGQRLPLVDGAVIDLKRRPFSVSLRTSQESSFRLMASEDTDFLEKARPVGMRHPLMSDFLASKKHEGELKVFSRVHDDDGNPLMMEFNELGATNRAFDFGGPVVQKVAGVMEKTHLIERLEINGLNRPLTTHNGSRLFWLLGPVPDLGSNADFFQPALVTLKFAP